MKKYLFMSGVVAYGILIGGTASAYQPRLVLKDIVEIKKPEVAQIFHGNLSGKPQVFYINAQTGVNLSLQITTPDVSGSRKDIDVHITSSGENIAFLDHTQADRSVFHEPHGEDNYLSGALIEKSLHSGVYTITVSNTENIGTYALFIGHELQFPHHEVWHAMLSMPYIKTVVFHKSWRSVIPTRVGAAWAILFFGIITITTIIFLLYKKMMKISHTKK